MIFLLFLQLCLGSLFSCQGQLPPPPSLVAVGDGGDHTATDSDIDTDTGTGTDTDADTATDSDTDTETDTGSGGLVSILLCPEEMAFISSTTCIDRWEVGIDLDAEGGPASFSEVGITPHLDMTYTDFARACENTPVRIEGEEVAKKRLPTHEEWTASGGEATYSFGEDWENDVCITPDLDASGASSDAWTEVQPTGSAPLCVSPFGVYDLTGNAWEWTDSGIVADGAATIATLAKTGVTIEIDEEGYLLVPDGRTAGMRLSMQATDSSLNVNEETSRLYTPILDVDNPPRAGGYLFPDATGNLLFLPVTVETDTEIGVYWLKYSKELDAQPVPDKTGCAYYSGSFNSCALGYSSLGSHTPEFSGSIGGRCAATPIAAQVTQEEAESLVATHQAGWP